MSENKILDVSTVNNYIKNLFEGDVFLSRIYVKGEISNLNKHYTGHYYFTLKDENSKISCMMFSSYVTKLKNPIKNGDQVVIFGKVSAFNKLGTYQIYVYNIDPYGQGKYLLMLEELKKKLKAEGLFDHEKKKLNLYPNEIALVTSKSGAAVQDLIHTITSRWPCIIKIYPCLVQGEGAPKSIIKCLRQADNSSCDTIILARGGGANEDLIAFNDEELVRTCASLSKPLISAIGHQIDTSLVDFVSDYPCITPTEAGEKACVNIKDLYNNIEYYKSLSKRLINAYIHSKENQLLQLLTIIENNNPKVQLANINNKVISLRQKADFLIKYKSNELSNKLLILKNKVELLNPNLIFDKGYAITYINKQKLKSVSMVKKDDLIDIKLKDGIIKTRVEEINKYGK